MSRVLLWGAILAIPVFVWLAAGRALTSLLDRFITIRATSLPVSPLKYDGGGLVIGNVPLVFASLDNLRSDILLTSDGSNRVILSLGRESFTLGPRTNPVDPSGRPEVDFVADPGDELSFNSWQSALGWPTPFEIRIHGGRAPWWKRYVYYRFVLKKRPGSKLEMLWRYEQQYHSASGWSKPAMMWNSQTGLLSVDIRPGDRAASEDPVVLGASDALRSTRNASDRRIPAPRRPPNRGGRACRHAPRSFDPSPWHRKRA